MAQINGVRITASIVPTDTTDEYSTHDPRYGIDGLRSLDDLDSRNDIPMLRRREGMIAYTPAQDSHPVTYWRLLPGPWTGNDTDWIPIPLIPDLTNQSGKFLINNGSILNWTAMLTIPSVAGKNGFYLHTNGSGVNWQAVIANVPSPIGQIGKKLGVTTGNIMVWTDVYWPDIQGNVSDNTNLALALSAKADMAAVVGITESYTDPPWLASLSADKVLPPYTAGMILTNNGTVAAWSDTLTTAGFVVAAAAGDDVPLAAKAHAAQSVNLQEWQNAAGVAQSAVDDGGYAFPVAITFVLGSGTPVIVGADQSNHYLLVRDSKLVEAVIVAKTGPTGTTPLAVNIEYSDASGAWHAPTPYYIWDNAAVVNQLKIVDGASAGDIGVFTGGANGAGVGSPSLLLLKGTRLRLNVTSVGNVLAGQDITVQLLCLIRNLV